ncbi:hypothetical protein [Desulfosoma caldarium]|uniref:Uncharacterized protein n=1 Tax=Desulfosoma caldarium TaxID=610254 RepID=A0A3N1VK73_9BACT|nr:hypothetical protein [Desulfosoma caldarium]ROR03216.1 hypothetical protein EDC27_0478 [Desulfosoma caldarium]
MQEKSVRLFLFPHSVLPESVARCLLTVWPTMDCLQAIGPAFVPDWAKPLCPSHGVVKEESFWEQVRRVLKGYQELGSRVGEDGLMAVISRDWAVDEAPETRSHIQSVLRGISSQPYDAAEGLFVEALVFLEMAKDLDIRELELSTNLEEMEQLEEKLYQALGADEEDSAELQRALETANPPLSPDWGHFGYLLRVRIGFWFRLWSRAAAMEQPIALAALSRDVVDEALDALQTQKERQGGIWERGESRLLNLPRVDLLSPAAFAEWLEAVGDLEARARFLQGFEALVQDPRNADRLRDVRDGAQSLEQSLQSLWRRSQGEAFGSDGYRVVLTVPENVTYRDMWRSVDRAGLQTLGPGAVSQNAAVLVHVEPERL